MEKQWKNFQFKRIVMSQMSYMGYTRQNQDSLLHFVFFSSIFLFSCFLFVNFLTFFCSSTQLSCVVLLLHFFSFRYRIYTSFNFVSIFGDSLVTCIIFLSWYLRYMYLMLYISIFLLILCFWYFLFINVCYDFL